MTIKEIQVYVCDVCGHEMSDGTSDYIKQCVVCDKDFCEDCQQDHMKDECFP